MMEHKIATFLLGYSHCVMKRVQNHLIQGEHSTALSIINEELRYLKEEIEKTFYAKETTSTVPLPQVPPIVARNEEV